MKKDWNCLKKKKKNFTFQVPLVKSRKEEMCTKYPDGCCSVAQSCRALWHHGLSSLRLLCPWDFSGKYTDMCCHFLLQKIFLTQGSNLCLLHCRQILYHWATRQAQISWHAASVRITLVFNVNLGRLVLYSFYRWEKEVSKILSKLPEV